MLNSGQTFVFATSQSTADRVEVALRITKGKSSFICSNFFADDRISRSIACLFIVEISSMQPTISDHGETEDERGLASFMSDLLRLADNNVVVVIGNKIPTFSVVEWMQRGMFSYIDSAYSQSQFDVTIHAAMAVMLDLASEFRKFCQLQERFAALSDAEAEVLESILRGDPNKAIARELGVSQRAIESRRHKLYGKLAARSVVDLVKTVNEFDSLRNRYFRHEAHSFVPRNHKLSKAELKDTAGPIHESQPLTTDSELHT